MTSPLLTHSRMLAAKSCLRRHQFLYEIGIRRDRDGQPLRMGKAFHLGLEARAAGLAEDQAIAKAVEGYAELPAWAKDEAAIADWLLERQTVARLLSGYFWRWSDAPLKVIANELEFNLPILNPETGRPTPAFRLAGRIDKIAELADGRLAVVEHKTTSEDLAFESDYWARLRIDQQISVYVLAARSLGYHVQTVLYDAARKPLIRPRKLTKAELAEVARTRHWCGEPVVADGGPSLGDGRESIGMYGARLSQDIAEWPDWYFVRREIPRLDTDLDEFRFELWQLQGLIRDCQRLGRWPRNTAACLAPWRCEFADLCFFGLGIDPAAELPAGYVRVANVHPELSPPPSL